MSTNAELKAKRLARQKKKKEATGGKSLGTESFTVIQGKEGKADTWTSRASDSKVGEGMTDLVASGKLKKGTNVKKLMEAEGKHQIKKRKGLKLSEASKHSKAAKKAGVDHTLEAIKEGQRKDKEIKALYGDWDVGKSWSGNK